MHGPLLALPPLQLGPVVLLHLCCLGGEGPLHDGLEHDHPAGQSGIVDEVQRKCVLEGTVVVCTRGNSGSVY